MHFMVCQPFISDKTGKITWLWSVDLCHTLVIFIFHYAHKSDSLLLYCAVGYEDMMSCHEVYSYYISNLMSLQTMLLYSWWCRSA